MEEISPKDDILIKLKSSFSTTPKLPSFLCSFTMEMNECHKQKTRKTLYMIMKNILIVTFNEKILSHISIMIDFCFTYKEFWLV